MTSFPKPIVEIKGIEPYENARAIPLSHPSRHSFVKLDCNEATYAPSPLVKKSLIQFIQEHPLNWYPDTECQDLKKALSEYVGYPQEFISVFNGCDRALESLCRAYLEKGDEVVILAPTYDNFRVFAEAAGGTVIPVYAKSPFETNIGGIDKAINPRTKIVYFANPTNPTGVTYSHEQINYILNSASYCLVIVDEAYFEFWGHSSLSLIKDKPNMVITRSFSKAFALAGLRCGYLVASPKIVKDVEKLRNGKNVNSLAQVAAVAALRDMPYYKERITEMHRTKDWFVRELKKLNIPIVDTPANFVLISVAQPDNLSKFLESQGVLVRNRSKFPQLEGYLRITIGVRSEMKRVVNTLKSIDGDLLYGSSKLRILSAT